MARPGSRLTPETIRFSIVIMLTLACFWWGGGSRNDIPGLIILQPFAVLCIAALLLAPGEIDWPLIRTPLVLLGALAAIMLVQLVPLPPSIWAALPGQDRLISFVALAGDELPWRTLSVTPDLTLAGLIGLVVPLAGLIGFAALPRERAYSLLNWLLGALALGALLGLGQLLGGENSNLYRYSVTNEGSAVGLFANRNHQAVFLAMGWPMLALWAAAPHHPQRRKLRGWIAAAMAIFLLPMLAATGSRAGLFFAIIGLGAGWWVLLSERRFSSRSDRRQLPLALKIGLPVCGLVVLAAATMLSRAEAVRRLFEENVTGDLRSEIYPRVIQIARDFAPFGSGFGSFDPIFKLYEPEAMLRSTYLNHAHNDLLELAMTGGVPALVVAGAFLLWLISKAVTVFRASHSGRARGFGVMAVSAILIILLSSLVDYPLRTPLLGLLFAFFCGWLARAPEPSERHARPGNEG